jgi:hypothetical protein
MEMRYIRNKHHYYYYSWEMMDVNTTGYFILLAMKELHTPQKITWLFSFYAMFEMSLQTAGR